MSESERNEPEREYRRPLVSMTCARDGLAHLLTDAEFARGLSVGVGIYQALCGASVLVCSMSSAPGRSCRSCREAGLR